MKRGRVDYVRGFAEKYKGQYTAAAELTIAKFTRFHFAS